MRKCDKPQTEYYYRGKREDQAGIFLFGAFFQFVPAFFPLCPDEKTEDIRREFAFLYFLYIKQVLLFIENKLKIHIHAVILFLKNN